MAIKALRFELRSQEFELDGLIKSVIDFPQDRRRGRPMTQSAS